MNVIFCASYSRYYKEIRRPLSGVKAQHAHHRRQLYAAVLYEQPPCLSEDEYIGRDLLLPRMPDGQLPFAFLEIKDSYVAVDFFDDFIRPYMNYQYQEFEHGRLFLSMAARRYFIEDTNEVADGKVWFFKPDGSVVVKENEDHREWHMDVSDQWKAYPPFGQYNHLLEVKWGSLTDGLR